MTTAYYISVWLHIICAAFWIGGMLFLPLILLPSIKNNPQRKQLLMATGLKFRFYGYIVLTLALFSGVLNIYTRGLSFSWSFFTESDYGKLVSIKIILFTVMLLISMVHDMLAGKKAMEQMGEQESARFKLVARWTGRVLLLIALVMAFIGVVISRGG
ncbi:MAG: CopD family protein [Sphingobacteriales bacterium]|nr:CopD family protein [Sphingobacteriales bacterium]MBI3720802.1 CopD family protein [Sphingobacteriales bacterium]